MVCGICLTPLGLLVYWLDLDLVCDFLGLVLVISVWVLRFGLFVVFTLLRLSDLCLCCIVVRRFCGGGLLSVSLVVLFAWWLISLV